jgi:citrate synthase
VSYDPALLNTASARARSRTSTATAAFLRYRGYPIEELAEKSSFLETPT